MSEHLPFGEDLEELERLSAEQGLHAIDVPEKLIEDELRRKSPPRRIAEALTSVVLVAVIFAFVIPWLTKADYGEVWDQIKALSLPEVAVLFAMWFASMFTIWSFLTHTLPGLTRSQAAVMNLSGSAVANVVPFGGAVGVGATYAQGLSWGFDPPNITLSVLVSGVWNVFSKLVFPVVALTMLALSGTTTAGLNVAALVSVAGTWGAVAVFAALIRYERAAVWVGTRTETVVNAIHRVFRRSPPGGVSEAVLDFRRRSVALVKQRWLPLTTWMVLYKVTSFLLQLACVRAIGIGDDLTWVEVFAAYALGEIMTASPLTPSGVGGVELASAGAMISFGAPQDAAVAAVLLFRAFTYLFEIPVGAIAWLVWATKRSWRRAPGSLASPAPASVSAGVVARSRPRRGSQSPPAR